jgi:chemotaxis protein methyltransferase CheR
MYATEPALSAGSIDRLAAKIETETGLSFHGAKRRDLTVAIRRMTESLGLDRDAKCVDWLLSGHWDKAKAELCAFHLTIGETYFFREPRAFDLVCDYAREKIQIGGAASRLRIWSAGCCTGEEPYSIAMVLKQTLPELDPSRISILGTDINNRHLRFAREGVYRHWSFRSTGSTLQHLNFSAEIDGRFRLHDQAKEPVNFSELNLAAPVYPSVATNTHSMDIIFCRNVLMYFSKAQARRVIERFRQCLVNGGWLIVSPSEASADMFPGFSAVYHTDAIYFRKNDPLHREAVPCAGESIQSSCRNIISRRVEASADQNTKRDQANDRDEQKRNATLITGNVIVGTDATTCARMLANEGKTVEAMRCINEAIEIAPTSTDLYFAKAMVAMEARHDREALQSVKRVIYLDPDCTMAHYLAGLILHSQDKHGEAVKKFETVSALLAALPDDELIPRSEGLSCAYLRTIVESYLPKERA